MATQSEMRHKCEGKSIRCVNTAHDCPFCKSPLRAHVRITTGSTVQMHCTTCTYTEYPDLKKRERSIENPAQSIIPSPDAPRLRCSQNWLEHSQNCRPTSHKCPKCQAQVCAHAKALRTKTTVAHCSKCEWRLVKPKVKR